LKIAGRVAFFTVFSDYQPPPPKLQHIQIAHYPLAAAGTSGTSATFFSQARRRPAVEFARPKFNPAFSGSLQRDLVVTFFFGLSEISL
jgi:hypothetical protein